MDYFAVYVGEAEVPTRKAIGELFVIETHKMEDGGVQVVDMNGFIDCPITEVIRCSVGQTALYASSRQPQGESVVVVVSPQFYVARSGLRELYCRSSSEFSTAQH